MIVIHTKKHAACQVFSKKHGDWCIMCVEGEIADESVQV